MKFLRVLPIVLLFLCKQAIAVGFSSGSSSAGETAKFKADEIIAFAKKVEKSIAAKGARVAILARMGRPKSELPEGMHFTHIAFAVYSTITTADGRQIPGYAIHNLYQRDDNPAASQLAIDYPVDFFAGAAELEAGIIVPSAELQRRLLDIIGTPNYESLHEQSYSVIANPYTLGHQNCTEFVLDVVNAAIYKTSDIAKLKEVTKSYFIAQPVNVSPFKLLLGTMFSKEVSTSDQPDAPVTATFEKIGEYLSEYDDGSQVLSVFP